MFIRHTRTLYLLSSFQMAPIATQSPQPRPPLRAVQTHSRSSSFFSFLSKQPSNSIHHRTISVVSKDSPPSPPNQYLSPRTLDSHPAAPASLSPSPPAHNTPSPQQSPPLHQHQPSYVAQQQQQMVRTPPVQSPLARDPSTQPSSSSQSPPTSKPAQPPPGPPPLRPEIRSVVQLNEAHAHKIYFSGPLTRRIERQPDGNRPHKDEGWCEIWAQLSGTTLSIWDMKQIQEASKQGKKVPPSYVNVTDAVSPPSSNGVDRILILILGTSSSKSLKLWLLPQSDLHQRRDTFLL